MYVREGDQIAPTNHLPDLVQHEALSLHVQGYKLDLSSLMTGGAASTAKERLPTLGGGGRGEGNVYMDEKSGLHQTIWDPTFHRMSSQVCTPQRT